MNFKKIIIVFLSITLLTSTLIPIEDSFATTAFVRSVSISAQESDSSALVFNTDGTKMFVLGNGGDDVNEYTLSTGFDLSSTVNFVTAYSISAKETDPTGLAFNTDGTKMFVSGRNSDNVHEYTLSTGFDLSSTIGFESSRSIADSYSGGLDFNTDGTKMFVLGDSTDKVHEYTLSTGFDLSSTYTYIDSFAIADLNEYGPMPESLDFNSDGTKMFVGDKRDSKIYEYSCTAFDVSTCSYVDNFSVSSNPRGLDFNSDGTKMFVSSGSNVKEYSLTIGFDLNTPTAPAQVGTVTVTPGTDTTALSWSAPSDGGSSITDYVIQISPDDSTWSTFSDGTSTATTATVTGLPKGTAYYFKVAAVNSVGTGSYSNSGSGTSFDYDENYTFTGTQSFDTGTRFQDGTTFKANQDFSGGAMTFGANQVFDDGTKFAASQSFGSAQTFGDAQEFGSGGTFAASNTWGEKTDFSAGTQTFNAAQTFGAAAKFAANQDFTNVNHDFSAAAMFFNSGGQFSAGEVMGVGADFSSGVQTFGSGMTFGEATEFADSQDWGANAQTFDKYMHFGDSNDFTGKIQTFKEGTSFGTGTTFKDTQTIPVNTIPAFGIMLEQITCGTDTSANTCIPNDSSKYLAPGGFLTAGQDPAATSNSISSNDKSFAVEGAGLEMSFDTVSGDGTITSDLYDPANIPESTAVGDTGKVSVDTSAGTVETIGSVTNISTGTATVSGDITITLKYSESNIPAGTAESELTMLHYTGGAWITESNCTVDTANDKISCTVSSLSPFGVGGKASSSSSSSSSASSGQGGGSNNCISNSFGSGKSLMIYQVGYEFNTSQVTLQAYSTCGTVTAKVATSSGSQIMSLSSDQPFLNDNIVIYSATIDDTIEEFSIIVKNSKNSFDEKFYTHGNDYLKTYTGTTGYTSAQQGTQIAFSENTILQETPLDETKSIPVWIKNNAEWWADDTIDDGTFTTSIEFLINQNIISVSNLGDTTSEKMDSDSIPVWIKNNAEWWSDDTIDDETFLNGVEYLVEHGIISVN